MVVCDTCKEWIDVHKRWDVYFAAIETPWPYEDRPDPYVDYAESINRYWGGRAIWFIWHHRKHDIRWLTDSQYDDYYKVADSYKEVFTHEDDVRLREERNVKERG